MFKFVSYLCDSLSVPRCESSSSIDYASLHGGTRRVFQVAVLTFSMRCFVQGYI